MTDWDNLSSKRLINFLSTREYIYNRNHQNYKTYTTIKECADFGKLLKPQRSSKEVLDKITALRKDISLAKQIIQDGSDEYHINNLEKFKDNVLELSFMYTALFGQSSESITFSLNNFLNGNYKRKLNEEDVDCNKKIKTEIINTSEINIISSDNTDETQTISEDQVLMDQERNFRTQGFRNSFEALFSNDNFHDLGCVKNKTNNNIFKTETSDCQNYIQKHENENEENAYIEPYKILYLECTDEIATENEIFTLKIIKFLYDKPYYYKDDELASKSKFFKEKELNMFGKTFTPPITGQHVWNIMKELFRKFYESIEKPENEKWCWFEQCQFILNVNTFKKINSNEIVLRHHSINVNELERTRAEDPKLLLEVVSFIEDNPIFYDKSNEYFNDDDKKHEMKRRFKLALSFSYKERDIAKMLNFVEKRIIKETQKSHENVGTTALDQLFIKEESVKSETLIKNFVDYNDSSVQCNLYEDILEQILTNVDKQSSDCNCLQDLLQIFKKEYEFQDNKVIYTDKPPELNYDNTNIEENNCNNSTIGNYLIQSDFPEFSDYSSDDGIIELPFPNIQTNITARLSNGKLPCEDCDELFDNGTQLFAHKKIHGEKALICYKCGKICKYYRKLRMHENNCNPDGNKYCYDCELTFKSHLNYYDHINQYHTKSNPYICTCRQAFTSYNKIITHLNRSCCGSIDDCVLPDYVTKDYLKGFIEQRYANEEEFVKNMEKTKFWCKICMRNFVRNDVYMKHFTRPFHLKSEIDWLRKHNIDEIFACDFCNKGDEPTIFKNLFELVIHRHGTHHKCTLRQFFEEMENIAKDTQSVIELPADLSRIALTCRICQNKYEMNNFKQHFRSKEHKKCERSWIINHNLRSFTCKICCLEFDDMIEYFEHMHEIHLEWPTNKAIKQIEGVDYETIGKKYFKYYCSICDYKTNNKRFYSTHVIEHGAHFKCSCGESFRGHERLLAHRSTNNCDVNGCIEFSSKLVINHDKNII